MPDRPRRASAITSHCRRRTAAVTLGPDRREVFRIGLMGRPGSALTDAGGLRMSLFMVVSPGLVECLVDELLALVVRLARELASPALVGRVELGLLVGALAVGGGDVAYGVLASRRGLDRAGGLDLGRVRVAHTRVLLA